MNNIENKLVSIIMPTFNRAHLIEKAVKSVLSQTYQNFELIIIDNNSIDGTASKIKSFNDKRIRFFKIQNQGIIAKSRNKGIALSKGEYISFLDSDDHWKPDKLSISIKNINLGADIIFHDLNVITRSKINIFNRRIRTREVKIPIFDDLLFNGNALATSGVVVRKKIISKVKGFSVNPNLIAAEDYDLWLKISRVTNKFKRIPNALGYYLYGSSNTTDSKKTLINLKYIRKKYSNELRVNNKKVIPKWMAYEISRAYYKQGYMKNSYIYAKASMGFDQGFIINLKSIYTIIITKLYISFKNKVHKIICAV